MVGPDSTIEQLVGRARGLYSLPAVAMEVLRLTNNPTVDARALKECIENDPALTGRLLRVVNSSLFGLPREVSDLNQALGLLGTQPLKLLVLGFSLPVGLFEGIEADLLGHYWRHTLTKAVAAREIAETIWNEAGDEPFLAGLLQDLGVLLLVEELGEPYVRLLEKSYHQGAELGRLESQAMGFDHVELCARLLESWGLPEALIETVLARESESMQPGRRAQVRILHLAEWAARLVADEQVDALPMLLELGRKYHNVSQGQLDELLAGLTEKVRQLADVLSLQLPGSLDCRDILARAHAQLADVALSAAIDLSSDRAAAQVGRYSDDVESLRTAAQRLGSGRPARPTPAPKPMVAPRVPAGAPEARPAAASAIPASFEAPLVAEILAQLEEAVAACRRSRCPLSLLLVDPGGVRPDDGQEEARRLQQSLLALCRRVDHPYVICRPYATLGCAVVLADCDRPTAVGLGTELIHQVKAALAERTRSPSHGGHVAVGAATVSLPPKNFPPGDLLQAAQRCLYGSHASGGGVVKSIEIY